MEASCSEETITIRPATKEDADFLGRICLLATRSHLTRGLFDAFFGGTDEELLSLSREFVLAPQEVKSFACWDGFIIAEVNGTPAAALSGYSKKEKGVEGYLVMMRDALIRRGWTQDQFEDLKAKREAAISVLADKDDQDAWVVEWVACLPEFRRRGLIERLLRTILETGRQRGHKIAYVSFYIGNLSAQRAYEKVGFVPHRTATSPIFRTLIDTDGLHKFKTDL